MQTRRSKVSWLIQHFSFQVVPTLLTCRHRRRPYCLTASTLWKSADKASLAAEAMNITADRLKSLKLIDNVVKEPLGGAHRDYDTMAENLKARLLLDLRELADTPSDTLVEQRFERLMHYGYC